MNQENELNVIIWDIHDTHPDLVEPLRQGLENVIDPEIGMNVLQLGLIRKVSIEDGETKIKMILTTPFCPFAPEMVAATRSAATESLKQPATVDMGIEAWDLSMMEDPSALDWGMY